MATKRQYSDSNKASALAILDANGGNLSKTSRETGVPISTIKEWRDGRVNPDVTDIRNVKKIELADKLEEVANAYTDHLLRDETINKTGAKDAAVTVGTAIDKMRLLRGLPTEIIQVLPPLVSALEDAGLNPSEVFNAMLARLHADRKQSAR